MKQSAMRLATALVCAAGLSTAQAQGISDDVVKIAVLSDMSSLYADTAGKGSVEAAKMAIADFGGTVLGKKIELVSADHQNKADVASTKARQWFDSEGVDMVMSAHDPFGFLAHPAVESLMKSSGQGGEAFETIDKSDEGEDAGIPADDLFDDE